MADTPKKTERKAGLRQSNAALWSGIRDLILEARQSVVRSVNAALVWTNFEIGRRIVEHEQGGKARADYAEETLISLSKKLTAEFGCGYSVDNLELMRKFYFVYAKSETLSRKSESSASPADKKYETLLRIPPMAIQLSWSHYVFLMGIDDENERRFYEIELAQQNWSLRELRRSLIHRCMSGLPSAGIKKRFKT